MPIQTKNYGFEINGLRHVSGRERDGLPVTIDKSKRLSGSCVCQLKRRERNK